MDNFIYIYHEKPNSSIQVQLQRLQRSRRYATMQLPAGKEVGEEFRVIKVPVLLVYGNDDDEKSRVEGNSAILSLLQNTL